jgi:AcrR family transcriptional regulator
MLGQHLGGLRSDAAGVGKPVLYTAFRTRTELVSALLRREHQRGLEQVLAGMPDDLTKPGPTGAYAATVSAFLRVVLGIPRAGGSF